MKKEQVLARLKEDCLVAVVRAKNLEQGEKVVDAIIAGGINFIEITMTMDEGNPVEFIKLMADKYKDNEKVVIGAGTVLDPETARQVILAGANYVVSPSLNVETIKLCNRYRVPMLPGVMTPTEAVTALRQDATLSRFSQVILLDGQLSAPLRDLCHRANLCHPAVLTLITLINGSPSRRIRSWYRKQPDQGALRPATSRQ